MDTTGWMNTHEEATKIFFLETRYTLVKESIVESLLKYSELVKTNTSKVRDFIKQSSALRLEVSYCDETYVIDCSKFRIIENRIYACIEAYRQQRGLGEDEEKLKYQKIFDFLYTDGDRIYELEDDGLERLGIDFITGINAFILFVFSKNFELSNA